jgi:hypothetical protein
MDAAPSLPGNASLHRPRATHFTEPGVQTASGPLKGTGFSPYIQSNRNTAGFSPRGNRPAAAPAVHRRRTRGDVAEIVISELAVIRPECECGSKEKMSQARL